MRSRLRAPFPWYGGKSRVADLVWRAFGDVPNLVEPFCGSLAVLLGRPANHNAKVETANDKDGFICNVWRAIAGDPDAVARYVDWPVNEADLHARHQWLVDRAPSLLEQPCGVLLDPPYAHGAGRDKLLYRHDDGDVSAVVRAWAVEHGDNPSLRIALCGWEGEHEMPSSWRKVAWTSGGSSPNRVRERVWFSPHCLEVDAQRDLLTNIEPEGRS